MTCRCHRCVRTGWPDSEVEPTSRRWLAFELLREVDVVRAHGAASWTEAESIGLDPTGWVAA
jgi:hypothetical protein